MKRTSSPSVSHQSPLSFFIIIIIIIIITIIIIAFPGYVSFFVGGEGGFSCSFWEGDDIHINLMIASSSWRQQMNAREW